MSKVLNLWVKNIRNGNIKNVVDLYSQKNLTFLPTLNNKIIFKKDDVNNYFQKLLTNNVNDVDIVDVVDTKLNDDQTLLCGNYNFSTVNGNLLNCRYSFIIEDDKIIHHHSSMIP